jgi:hypothetical protein
MECTSITAQSHDKPNYPEQVTMVSNVTRMITPM